MLRYCRAAIVGAVVVGVLLMSVFAVSTPATACITGPGKVQPSAKCINIYYQTAWTATDAQYSHDSHAYIQAYSSGSWGMTTSIWADVDGNKLAYSTTYSHAWISGYGAQGQTTFFNLGFNYQLWQDYYSGSYRITPYTDLQSIFVENKGGYDWKAMPPLYSPNTHTVTLSPGLPPYVFGFKAESSSNTLFQLGVAVNVFGTSLDIGISWAHQSGYEQTVTITFTNPGTTLATWIIYWEFLQDVPGGLTYGFMAHVWRYS